MSNTHDRFGRPQPQFIIDYLEAFASANPARPAPIIWDRKNTWVHFEQDGVVLSKRKSQIIAMTAVLRDSGASA